MSALFLATTALEEFWDRDKEILFLGPWCMKADKHPFWNNLRYRLLPSPWDDRSTREEAFQYIEACNNRMLTRLSRYLNLTHHSSYSERYWRILVGPWLMHYVHVLYDRHLHLTSALREYPDLESIVLHPRSYSVPTDTDEFVSSIHYDRANLQIFSQLLSSMGYKFPDKASLPIANIPQHDFRSNAIRIFNQARNQLEDFWGRTWNEKAPVLLSGMCCDADVLSKLKMTLNARHAIQEMPLKGPAPAWDERRSELEHLDTSDAFERHLVRWLPHHFPTLYLEGYLAARSQVLKKNPNIPPILMSATDWGLGKESFKFLAAEASVRGHRLISIQHGGGYGSVLFQPGEIFERHITDTFITWGWADQRADSGCRNMPALKMATRRFPKPRPWSQKSAGLPILFVATNQARYLQRIHSVPLAGQWEDYFSWQTRFFKALPVALYKKIRFRRHPVDYDMNTQLRISQISPDIKVERLKNKFTRNFFYERLKSCSLTVVDHCDTAFLEILAANIPTVLFWDPQRWLMRAEALPYYDDLRRVGILHDSPELAANKVAEVHDQLQIWWDAPELQAVRKEFADHFCFTDDAWTDIWGREIRNEVALIEKRAFSENPKQTEFMGEH